MKQLSLHITDLCNEKCGFCVVGSPLAKSDSVVYADLVRFLVDNADEGFESVNLHGGEPTIHPRLFELLNLIKMLEYPQTHIQTNARRLKNWSTLSAYMTVARARANSTGSLASRWLASAWP